LALPTAKTSIFGESFSVGNEKLSPKIFGESFSVGNEKLSPKIEKLGIVVTDYEDIKAATLKQRQKMDTRLQTYVPNLFELVSSLVTNAITILRGAMMFMLCL
jgi:hypothetical protein